jgi:hypothetical protein
MSITTLAGYEAAAKQKVYFQKTVSGGPAARWVSTWASGAVPAAGSFAVGSTTVGVVPDNTTTGAGAFNAYTGTGYITGGEFSVANAISGSPNAVNCRLFDRLFHCGTHAFNAADTLGSQPSYSARVPGGADFTGLQIWMETTVAFVGQCTIAVTYTDQDGNAGATTGTVQLATVGSPPAAATMFQLPLAAGDSGVQKIESVTSTVTSAGNFNILVLRPLESLGLFPIDHNSGVVHGFDKTGFIWVPSTACLMYAHNIPSGGVITDAVFELASA